MSIFNLKPSNIKVKVDLTRNAHVRKKIATIHKRENKGDQDDFIIAPIPLRFGIPLTVFI